MPSDLIKKANPILQIRNDLFSCVPFSKGFFAVKRKIVIAKATLKKDIKRDIVTRHSMPPSSMLILLKEN